MKQVRMTNQHETRCKTCGEIIAPGEGNIVRVQGAKICGYSHMEWRATHKSCEPQKRGLPLLATP